MLRIVNACRTVTVENDILTLPIEFVALKNDNLYQINGKMI